LSCKAEEWPTHDDTIGESDDAPTWQRNLDLRKSANRIANLSFGITKLLSLRHHWRFLRCNKADWMSINGLYNIYTKNFDPT
jgi:hypothetical protein